MWGVPEQQPAQSGKWGSLPSPASSASIPGSAVPLCEAEVLSGHDASSLVLLVTWKKVNCVLTSCADVCSRQSRQRDMAPTLLTPQECWGWAAGPMTPHVPKVPWPQPWPADTPQNSMLVMGLLMHTVLLAAAQDSEGQRGQSEDPAALGSTQHPSLALMWHRELTGSSSGTLQQLLNVV